MRIGVIGGTGREGRGLALRWSAARHVVRIGSRDAARAEERAAELRAIAGTDTLTGGGNAWAVSDAEVVVLCVPYAAHDATLRELAPHLAGKVLVDITVPLNPPKVREVHLPPGHAAALEAQAILGASTQVVSTLHHVSSAHLGDPDHQIEGDVLVCSDHPRATEVVIGLLTDLGAHALDAGPLRNAVALEALTPVLLYLNKRYQSTTASLRIAGLAHSHRT